MAKFNWDDFEDAPEATAAFNWDNFEDADKEPTFKDKALEFSADTINGMSDLSRSLSEGVYGYGLLQKAGIAAGAAVRAPFVDESFDEIYDEALKRDMKKDMDAHERSPILTTAGNIAGGLATPGIKGSKWGLQGAKGVAADIATRVAGNAALSGVDSATRGKEVWDGDRGFDSALMSGGITAGFEALPYVRKLLPAVKGSLTNKPAAFLAGLNPFSKATSDEIEDLYSDVGVRRMARKADINGETIAVADKLNMAEGALKNKVSEEYQRLEEAVRDSPLGPNDKSGVRHIWEEFKSKVDNQKLRPEMFSNDIKKVTERIYSTLKEGSINESKIKAKWAGQSIADLRGDDRILALRGRLLDARRDLDDVLKNKKWNKLNNRTDFAQITEMRNSLNEQLHNNLSGSSHLKQADELYGNSLKVLEDSIGSTKVKGKVDPTRLRSNMNTSLVRGKQFETGVKGLEDFYKNSEAVLGNIPEVSDALVSLRELQALAAKRYKLDIAERAAGGPSGQGVNTMFQYISAYTSNGLSLLALPITNPAAYTRLIDALAELGDKEFSKKMNIAVKAAMKKAPGIVARLSTMREDNE